MSEDTRDEAGVRAAVQDLFSALGAADVKRLENRFSETGYTEFAGRGGGRLLQEDTLQSATESLAAGLQVRVRILHLEAKLLGPDVALATGYRFGVMYMKGDDPGAPQTHRMSMVLRFEDKYWRLKHVHYSLVAPQ